jgi:predicted nuclease of predicted toxin-antitoxin system
MRVLIDECVDPRVKLLIREFGPSTVHEQGWDTLEDGDLLTAAQKEFDVLVTIDRGIEFQQNLSKFQIGVVIAHVPRNQVIYFRVMQKELLAAIGAATPGRAVHVRMPVL